jgi:hypothetical protein
VSADVPAHLLAATAAPASTVAVMRSAERAEVEPEAAELVAQARHDGTPLDEPTRSRLEASLGRSLGHVRVHTGADADTAARALGARAFAIGPDLFFRDGAYDPSSRDGQHLIAHEVAHVVQVPGAAVASAEGLAVSQPGDAREREAESFAERFVHGPERGDASPPITHAEPPGADAGLAPFAIHQRGGLRDLPHARGRARCTEHSSCASNEARRAPCGQPQPHARASTRACSVTRPHSLGDARTRARARTCRNAGPSRGAGPGPCAIAGCVPRAHGHSRAGGITDGHGGASAERDAGRSLGFPGHDIRCRPCGRLRRLRGS